MAERARKVGKVRLRISILSSTWFFFMERTFGLPCMQGSFCNGPAKFLFEEARPAENPLASRAVLATALDDTGQPWLTSSPRQAG